MNLEKAEDVVILAEKNKRLQALVGELLKKNEGLRQQLELLQQAVSRSSPAVQLSLAAEHWHLAAAAAPSSSA